MSNSIVVLRSVPLHVDTRKAWTVNGCYVAPRKRFAGGRLVLPKTVSRVVGTVLNLGCRYDFSDTGLPVFNSLDSVRAISRPADLRATLNDFLPERTVDKPHWHKVHGFGGVGKRFCVFQCSEDGDDIQEHVDGIEYRIVTVGDRVVQASRKSNLRWTNGKHDFDWQWVGVEGVSKKGFIPMLKEAIPRVPDWERMVVGWDIIHDGVRPFIIEANFSFGVNVDTARRVIDMIRSIV